jgi:hypothetical protein
MRSAGWALSPVLAIAGLYFLIFHKDPLPLNHEAVGLGTLHLVHDMIGGVLVGLAVFLLWRSKHAQRAKGTG